MVGPGDQRGFGKGYESFDRTLVSDFNTKELADKLISGGYKVSIASFLSSSILKEVNI